MINTHDREAGESHLRDEGGLGKVFKRCLEQITIDSFLVAFKVSLLGTSQLSTESRSRFKASSITVISLLENARCVPSVDVLGCELHTQFGKALI